ncbi:MAG TPA: ankyrin repeat domain-containing protein [Spirochaetota bacterium]|nr:ankyrin repeat domain-containing protein [Spirochaetota bacterium]HQO40181.1 ankyrin repeat domain-containing protein [Spirochaetota bacterium]
MKRTAILMFLFIILVSGCKSLHEAATDGDASRVRKLISQGADVNAKDKDGKTALMLAAEKGESVVIKMLIDAQADVNVKDNNGRTALMYSAAVDCLDCVRYLVEGGSEVEAEDNSGETALFMTRKKSKVREELLKHSKQYRSQFLCSINTLFKYLEKYPQVTVSYVGRPDSGVGTVYYGDGERLVQHEGILPEMISVLKTYGVVFTEDFFKSMSRCKK